MPPPSQRSIITDASAAENSIISITSRRAKAVAHPSRVRILVELNKRPMSPSRFAEETGGSLTSTSQHFRRLEELGCIELAERRPGKGQRPGAAENIYRAVQRCLFDQSSWAAIPQSNRGDVTGMAFTTYIERVAEAAAAGTLDARKDRHFTWTAMYLDEEAWTSYISAVDTLFWYSLEIRVAAALRLAKTGEQPIPVTVFQSCFESPGTGADAAFALEKVRQDSRAPDGEKAVLVSPRLAKALAHPLRVRILVELNKRPMSPTQFAAHISNGAPRSILKHFRRLEELECIELSERRSGKGHRRGGTETVYRAVQESLFDESNWEELPQSLRADVTGMTFSTFIERVAEAAVAGTLDSREDRHFTWTAMHYDQQAWNESVAAMDALFRYCRRLRHEAAERLSQTGGPAIPVTTGLACFESPADAEPSAERVLEDYQRAARPHVTSSAIRLLTQYSG